MAPALWLLDLPVALLHVWWVREVSDGPVAYNHTSLLLSLVFLPRVIRTLKSTRDPGL